MKDDLSEKLARFERDSDVLKSKTQDLYEKWKKAGDERDKALDALDKAENRMRYRRMAKAALDKGIALLESLLPAGCWKCGCGARSNPADRTRCRSCGAPRTLGKLDESSR